MESVVEDLKKEVRVLRGEVESLRELVKGLDVYEGVGRRGKEGKGERVGGGKGAGVLLGEENGGRTGSVGGDKKRKVRSSVEPGKSRYWTPKEHQLFLEALKSYGHRDLRSIAGYVGTRNMTQVRTHAQKYYMRLAREAKQQKGENLSEDSSKAVSEPEQNKVRQQEAMTSSLQPLVPLSVKFPRQHWFSFSISLQHSLT